MGPSLKKKWSLCNDLVKNNSLILICTQGPQGLSVHFEMALTGRKNVAMSKLMVVLIPNEGTLVNIWSDFMHL